MSRSASVESLQRTAMVGTQRPRPVVSAINGDAPNGPLILNVLPSSPSSWQALWHGVRWLGRRAS